MVPGPTQVLNPNGSSIGAAVFAELTSVTDRPPDHATRSVTTGRIYVRMRPNNNSSGGNTQLALCILKLGCYVPDPLYTWLVCTGPRYKTRHRASTSTR